MRVVPPVMFLSLAGISIPHAPVWLTAIASAIFGILYWLPFLEEAGGFWNWLKNLRKPADWD